MTRIYPKISEEYSLYTHSPQLLDEFNALVNLYLDELPPSTVFSHAPEDFLASIFNYWIQLIESDELRIAKVDILMMHGLSIDIHQQVVKHSLIQEFVTRYSNRHAAFILAYFLSNEIVELIHSLLPEHLKLNDCQLKELQHFYTLTNSDLQSAEMYQLFEFRRHISQLLHSNLHIRKLFYYTIYNATKKARLYYMKLQRVNPILIEHESN